MTVALVSRPTPFGASLPAERRIRQPKLAAQVVQRIGVFRALMLGDLLCAVPALRALKHAYPKARLTLIGLPWARALCERLPYVDDFLPFPGFRGLPEIAPDMRAWPAFLAESQRHDFDLAIQLHGRGDIVNPIVQALGARHIAGFYDDGIGCPDPELFTRWPEEGHEIERLLRVIDALGVPRCGDGLEFPITDDDRASLHHLWPHRMPPSAGYVCLHAGAQLRSRRWPLERFAAVADALSAHGATIVLTGAGAERPLADALQSALRAPVIDMVGRTTLWQLGALIKGAALLVSNDTAVSHIAAAFGTPSVVVSSGADVARWAPLDAQRHRVLWHDVPCRPCAHELCPIGHPCALAVDVDTVVAVALEQLHATRSRHGH
jgi:ADP-heptose:LPS heptosyltransferase